MIVSSTQSEIKIKNVLPLTYTKVDLVSLLVVIKSQRGSLKYSRKLE